MIIAIDTETYEYNKKEDTYEPILNAQKFVLGCAKTDTDITMFFKEPKEMKEWLIHMMNKNKRNKKRTFIYAHHHEYDFYALWKDNLINDKLKYICFNPFIAIYDEKGYFLDTMAFYRMSLAMVGKIIGLPKLEMPTQAKRIEDLKPYLERDTEIVLKAVLNLKEKINKLGFNPRKILTSGQLAITSFLTYCRRTKVDREFTEYNMERKIRQIVKCKNPKEIREAFRGGMNRCFKLGKFNNVTLIDANALYAYIMTTMKFPNLRTEHKIEKPENGMLTEYMKEGIGIARVIITAPNITLPFLPIRFGKYTIYPQSREMRGTWTFQEIKEAMKLGYRLIECEWCIKWKELHVNPLKKFIEYLYSIEKGLKTKEERMPLKLIRNNLYGKFAQYKKNKDYKIATRAEIKELLQEGYTPISTIDNKYVCVKEMGEYDPSYTNPIISTLITAGARMFLYNNLKKIPHDDLLYCDTDSIAFKGDYMNKFKTGWNMGEWKIEAEGQAKFLGEKRYYIDDKPKISGLMKREISIDIIEEEKDVHTQRMIGLGTAIKEGNLNIAGTFRPHIHEMKPHNKLMLVVPDKIDEVKEHG